MSGPMPWARKVSLILSGVTTFCAITGSVVASYWLIFQPPSFHLEAMHAVTYADAGGTKPTARFWPGGTLYIRRNYCASQHVTVKAHRQFIDGLVYTLPLVEAHVDPGCYTRIVSAAIPKALPVGGTYNYRVQIEYVLNPFRTERVMLPDVVIELGPPPTKFKAQDGVAPAARQRTPDSPPKRSWWDRLWTP